MRIRHSSLKKGFVLLEIILAVGLFALVATSMVIALDRLSVASLSVRKEAAALRQLESVMTRVQHSAAFRTGSFEYPGEVAVTATVSPEPDLPDLYRIYVVARIPGEEKFSRELETVVYRPRTNQ
ncbi:MAG: type II secretion system protein [Verrucomicrobiales bacterium]|nr:type II secretion system protein [Verrucomicrobiales bacterium]